MYLCIYMNCMLLDKNRNQTWEWESILYYYMAGSPLLVKNCLIPTNGLSKVRPLKRFPIEFSQLNNSCQTASASWQLSQFGLITINSTGTARLPVPVVNVLLWRTYTPQLSRSKSNDPNIRKLRHQRSHTATYPDLQAGHFLFYYYTLCFNRWTHFKKCA